MQPMLLWAAEGGAERTGLDLVLPPAAELVGGIIAFAVVLLVLNRLAFPRLRETIQQREQAIAGDLREAEEAKAEAARTLEEYKRQLAEARSEANRIVEEARRQAEDVRRDLVARAEKEAEQILARAREQAEAERRRALQELQGTIANLSIELAEKVVGRSLDGQAQRELVDAYIREVAAMSPDGGR